MKRFVRLIPAILCFCLLMPLLASCYGGEPVRTSPGIPEGIYTMVLPVPVTEPVPVETESDYVFVPGEPDVFVFLRSAGSDSLLSVSPEAAPELFARQDRLLLEGIGLAEKLAAEILQTLRAGYLSGDGYDALLLDAVEEGAPALCEGLLQNLSAAGIGIGTDSPAAVTSLAGDLSFGGDLYLLPFRALTSDLKNAYLLSVTADSTAAREFSSLWESGSYTLEKVIAAVHSVREGDGYEISAAAPSDAARAVLLAAGGSVMRQNQASPVPSVQVSEAAFSAVYDLSLQVQPLLSTRESDIMILTADNAGAEGRKVFPLPPAEAGQYLTPVLAEHLTVAAAPSGLVYGRRTAAMLTEIAACSDQIRAAAEYIPGDIGDSMQGVLFGNLHLDPAQLFTWGDLYSVTQSSYAAASLYADLAQGGELDRRRKAAEGAAQIILGRLTEK